MTMTLPHPERAPISGRRLTALLARWAGAHRLDRHQADVCRQRVVGQPAPASFDWWWRLLDPEGGLAFGALPAASGWEAFGSGSGSLTEVPSGWAGATVGLPAWGQEDPEYQPYLR